MSGQIVSVNLGESKVSTDPAVIMVCFGLGSCVGVAAYDPQSGTAGLVHVVLPASLEDRPARTGDGVLPAPGRFADTAVPHLIAAMEARGASRRRLVVRLAGGAQMLAFAGSGPMWEIGQRNVAAVHQALTAAGVAPVAEDVGGNSGRTLRLKVDGGRVTVSVVGRGEREL